MPSINQSVRTVVTQGQDVSDKTAYVSGIIKDIFSVPIFGSGLQSGSTTGMGLTVGAGQLCSITMSTSFVSGLVSTTLVGLSGVASVSLYPGTSLVWWSGNGIPTPFAATSGSAISTASVQIVSGYTTTVSGTYTFDAQVIRNG